MPEADLGTCANDLAPILAGLSLYAMYMLFFVAFYFSAYVTKHLPGSTPRKARKTGANTPAASANATATANGATANGGGGGIIANGSSKKDA